METYYHEVEMDLQNLISCIECHKEERNAGVVIETLKTIVNICTKEEIGKDAFREVGGLDFLLQFIIDTDQAFILEFGLKVLAFVIDGNVHSQMHMTQDKVFRILQTIFKKKTYLPSMFKNATLLFSTLLFQNRSAQDIIQENGSLLSLINLYRCFVPYHASYSNSIEESEHLEVWLTINSALCFAVNNPLHEKNQETCSSLFPLSLKIIESVSNPVTIEATASFLSLSIANNEKNQDSFAELDGFQTLKHSLIRNFEEIQACIKECNNILRKRTLQILNSLIAIISATVLDHENNASLCGKLGIVSLMTKHLSTAAVNSSVMKKILLVLGHCIDACCENRFFILEVPKLDALLKKYLETDDTELCCAAKYLLQVCLNENNKENEINQDCYSQTGSSFLKSYQHRYKVKVQPRKDNFLKNISYQPNNSLEGLSDIYDHTLSEEFQNVNAPLHPLKLSTKCNQNSAIPDHYIRNKNSGNDSSESVGDISLHSAGHLYRLRHQIRERATCENDNFESIQKNKLRNCCAVDEMYHLNTGVENNTYNIKNMTDCQMSKQRSSNSSSEKYPYSYRKLSYTEKLSLFKNNQSKKRTLNKFPHPVHSSNIHGASESIPNNGSKCKDENKNLSPDKVQTLLVGANLNFPSGTQSENLEVNAQNKESTFKEHLTSECTLSVKPCCFALQGCSCQCSHKANAVKSRKLRTGSSRKKQSTKTVGCMEVIVLPGVTCTEHRLVAQLELLKVCPLQTDK